MNKSSHALIIFKNLFKIKVKILHIIVALYVILLYYIITVTKNLKIRYLKFIYNSLTKNVFVHQVMVFVYLALKMYYNT